MGRSPRTVFPEEAFRRILRAIYPERPALADEIQSYDWDYFQGSRWWFETKLTSDEIIAVNKAFELLHVAQGIRLRGALSPSKPLEDINPADVRSGKLDVFARELRVFLNNKLLRNYRQVDYYEVDVDRCAAELRSDTKLNRIPPAKPTSDTDLDAFTKNYKGRRSLNEFWAATKNEGLNVTRERADAALGMLGPRPRGRRANNWRPTPWPK
jgi:hypothetical protein